MAKRCAVLLKILWCAAMLAYTLAPSLWCTDRHSPSCHALREMTIWYKADAAIATVIILFPLSYLSQPTAAPLHGMGIVSMVLCALYPFLCGHYDFLEVSGIITGRVAAVTCGVLMLAVSRRALLVSFDDRGYIDLVPLHRAAGWWCVAGTMLHSLAFAVYYLKKNGWVELACACLPIDCKDGEGLNTLGLVNFLGVLGTLAGAVLAVFSIERLRRKRYELFYLLHLITSAAFVFFAAVHDFQMLMLALPGIVFYMQDRLSVRSKTPRDLAVQNLGASILLVSWSVATASKEAPGHRWVSINAESVAKRQWHPFSIFERKGRRHVLIKGLGDWSQGLLEASERSLKIQGPFGRPFRAPHARPRSLFLIAGGVGIAPFADLLHNLGEDNPWRRVSLLWAVRRNEYAAMAPALALAELSVEITVFITSNDLEAPDSAKPHFALPAAPPLPKPAGRRRAAYLLACVPALLSLAASLQSHESIVHGLRGSVSTLLGYAAAMRAAPVFAALALMLPGGVGALAAKAVLARKNGESAEELQERLTPATAPAQVKVAKPKLGEELEREAALGPLDVDVCGPQRMVLAVKEALAKMKGCDVSLEVHDPDL